MVPQKPGGIAIDPDTVLSAATVSGRSTVVGEPNAGVKITWSTTLMFWRGIFPQLAMLPATLYDVVPKGVVAGIIVQSFVTEMHGLLQTGHFVDAVFCTVFPN